MPPLDAVWGKSSLVFLSTDLYAPAELGLVLSGDGYQGLENTLPSLYEDYKIQLGSASGEQDQAV